MHAKGLRNPFRFQLRPGGGVAVGDVGWTAREEIDYAGGFMRRLNLDASGRETSVEAFATGWTGTDLAIAPSGNLSYVDFGTGAPGAGSVKEIVHVPVNRAAAVASPRFGPAPLSVDFDGFGSTDADGDALTYDWDFGDGGRTTPLRPRRAPTTTARATSRPR